MHGDAADGVKSKVLCQTDYNWFHHTQFPGKTMFRSSRQALVAIYYSLQQDKFRMWSRQCATPL